MNRTSAVPSVCSDQEGTSNTWVEEDQSHWHNGEGTLMNPPFQVRRATPDDASSLARLRYDFRVELDPPAEKETVFIDRCARWMARHLGPTDAWRCWLAE